MPNIKSYISYRLRRAVLWMADLVFDFQKDFNREAYLAAFPDVAEAGICPFYHWMFFGRREGRTWNVLPEPDIHKSVLPEPDIHKSVLPEPDIHKSVLPEPDIHKVNKLQPGIDIVNKLLKYGVSYADSEQILPPPGVPSDYINLANEEYLLQIGWLQNAKSIWLNEEINWHELFERDKNFIPHAINREGYHGDQHFRYWLHGYQDYRKTLKALEPYGITGGRYFDFGGSTGRVFRHFAFQSEAWDVWSSDFKLSSVEWNLRFFPKSIKTFLNNSNPSLPLSGEYFDLVTAYSVFTHINEPETSWLAEIRRILKVGGVAYLTIHDEVTWKNQENELHDTIVKFRPDIANLPDLPNEKTVVTFREDDPYNCNVFHSREYIENIWGRFFEICEIKPLYADAQAVVICRRRD